MREHGLMVEPPRDVDELASQVVDAAYRVHYDLGPGYAEQIYEAALCVELATRNIAFSRQHPVTVRYRGTVVGEGRIDLLIADRLIVELKTVTALTAVHLAQAIGYLKATGLPLALLINFEVARLKEGIRRVLPPRPR